jgi:hypothetical protein
MMSPMQKSLDEQLFAFVAALMVEAQGETAWVEAATRAHVLEARGDISGYERWMLVLRKIETLEARTDGAGVGSASRATLH